nr:hypothetical protein [uncultured Eubacterium sp.]
MGSSLMGLPIFKKRKWEFVQEKAYDKKGRNQRFRNTRKISVMMWQNHSVNELINEFSEIMTGGKSQFF